jgi:hypothetical protein
MEIRRALLFDATGATGREIGRELARRGIGVHAVSRDRSYEDGIRATIESMREVQPGTRTG